MPIYHGSLTIVVPTGYNPLNEPCDEEHTRLLAWYSRVEKAIRKIDPDHIVRLELIWRCELLTLVE